MFHPMRQIIVAFNLIPSYSAQFEVFLFANSPKGGCLASSNSRDKSL
jgi:hypothetical protein